SRPFWDGRSAVSELRPQRGRVGRIPLRRGAEYRRGFISLERQPPMPQFLLALRDVDPVREILFGFRVQEDRRGERRDGILLPPEHTQSVPELVWTRLMLPTDYNAQKKDRKPHEIAIHLHAPPPPPKEPPRAIGHKRDAGVGFPPRVPPAPPLGDDARPPV